MNATETLIHSQSIISEAATHKLAATIATHCTTGDCLLLQGDLGAGKTFFARGFIQYFLPLSEVTSPTFNLVQTYESPRTTLWHFDLYRLKSEAEIPEIGLDEALENGISLIEWPDIARKYWPPHALTIHIETYGESRQISLSGSLQRWQDLKNYLNTETHQ